jgi:excisionase family DNA binding protein
VVNGDRGGALTVRAAAGVLRCSTATVYKLCASGELRSFRVLNAVRVRVEDLEAFMARGTGKTP